MNRIASIAERHDFLLKLLRLKQVLGLYRDDEIASALGLTKQGLSERKRRGSFPIARVRSLAADLPHLSEQLAYVMTGDGKEASLEATTPAVQSHERPSIGSRLGEERMRLGLTQEAIGIAGGVRKLAQMNYESGRRVPDADYLANVSLVGVDVAFVVTGRRSE